MTVTDFIAALALIVSGVSFFFTILGEKRSHKTAVDANNIAQDALQKAKEANNLSKKQFYISFIEIRLKEFKKFDDIFMELKNKGKNSYFFISDLKDKINKNTSVLCSVFMVFPEYKEEFKKIKELLVERETIKSATLENDGMKNYLIKYLDDPVGLNSELKRVKMNLENVISGYEQSEKNIYLNLTKMKEDDTFVREYISQQKKFNELLRQFNYEIKERFDILYVEMEKKSEYRFENI